MDEFNGKAKSKSFFYAIFIVSSVAVVFLGSGGGSFTEAAATNEDTAAAAPIRSRRHAADQRLAEIQALLALGRMRTHLEPRLVYGHGLIDPHNVGRRKRFESPNRRDRENDYGDRANLNEKLLLEDTK